MTELAPVELSEDGIATVTLNRPDARNALSSGLLRDLESALDQVHDAGAKVLILTGADPAFCAGLDLAELGGGGENLGSDIVPRITGLGIPVIGAINGAAVTGGLEVALACDFRIAGERARFADTHARVGLLPGWGLSVRLPQAVGLQWAKQMSFTGQFVNAELALRIGLVNEVVPHEQLLPRAREIATEITEVDPEVLPRLRTLYDQVAETEQGLQHEERAYSGWNTQLDYTTVESRRQGIIERGRSLAR